MNAESELKDMEVSDLDDNIYEEDETSQGASQSGCVSGYGNNERENSDDSSFCGEPGYSSDSESKSGSSGSSFSQSNSDEDASTRSVTFASIRQAATGGNPRGHN